MPGHAFITGICGQDGFYLKEQLLAEGYTITGTDLPPLLADRPTTAAFTDCTLLPVDLADPLAVETLFAAHGFSEVYNLAGISFVPASWDNPHDNFAINAGIPLNLLEAARRVSPRTRIFQACSSELFGDCPTTPQDETTPFHPRSPYAVNKIHAWHMCRLYREYRGVFAACGILYNHESPRRPENFVTRKITAAAARISLGLAETLELGSLDAQRDWSFAGDTVRAMRLALAAEAPDDYIVASGTLHSVRDFCEAAFAAVGLDWRDHVRVNPQFVRAERSVLHGNPAKARRLLGWEPAVPFTALVRMMVEHDLARLQAERQGGQP